MDADGLIKLYRAGVLPHVITEFPSTVPTSVYEEVVIVGKARLHSDAEAIQSIIEGSVTIKATNSPLRPDLGLGAGESAILDLLPAADTFVVSDDRRFLTLLAMQATPFLTPAGLLVLLKRQGALTKEQADEALERLRPSIRPAAYWEARQDIQLRRRP